MKTNIIPALLLTLVMIVFFMGVYPLAVWGIAQFAPNNGEGKVIIENGNKYYLHIGQAFTEDEYFWSRPSAINYDSEISGGSNKGPSNPEYLAVVEARIDTFLMRNPAIEKSQIPVDMVTASSSGYDPHISPQGAFVQIPRIAKARGISEERLRELVENHINEPLLGLFGPKKVHVLKLNLALDNLTTQNQQQ